jgi:glycosyltransferase involved in cell wall biosynthesis
MGSHAQLMGKRTLGTDHGGGETHLYRAHPFLFDNFDILHAQSEFARYSFADAVRGTHVIKGPVDDDAFPMADAEHRDPRLFVAIGRYLPHKGFESLIDCLPQGCRLVIVGRPYDEEYLRFLVSRIGSKSVELKTTLSDEELLRLVGRAGLYLHSSVSSDFRGTIYLKSELLGLAPLESMCTGAPVICSDTAALQELGALRGCRTYRTKEQLSVLLTQYLDGTLRFPESSLIRDDACKHYGLAQFAEKYVAMLNMVN